MTTNFSDLIGKVITDVKVYHPHEIYFTCSNGDVYKMHHHQDCCESVTIEDIDNDLQNLVGELVLIAEERVNENTKRKSSCDDSFTWTFYTIRTLKDSCTIRWYGTSNGYYSESVSFEKVNNEKI